MGNGAIEPREIRDLPVETQVAVLYERVGTLREEVRALRRALWAFVFSILGGAVIFMFSIASGWIGPHSGLHQNSGPNASRVQGR